MGWWGDLISSNFMYALRDISTYEIEASLTRCYLSPKSSPQHSILIFRKSKKNWQLSPKLATFPINFFSGNHKSIGLTLVALKVLIAFSSHFIRSPDWTGKSFRRRGLWSRWWPVNWLSGLQVNRLLPWTPCSKWRLQFKMRLKR